MTQEINERWQNAPIPMVVLNNIQVGDRNKSLAEMVAQYEDKEIQKPDHQRFGDAWSEEKRAAYIQRIQQGQMSIGCFVTYQIEGGDGIIYLNDGLQRLTAACDYNEDPAKYGDTPEAAKKNLRRYEVTQQHRIYKNHLQAMEDFQAINQGTTLTSFQFGFGHLVYSERWATKWKEVFEKWHQKMDAVFCSFSTIPTSGYQISPHDVKRMHDYSLLLRLANNNSSTDGYPDVGSKRPNPEIFRKGKSVFQQMSKLLNSRSASDVESLMKETLNAVTLDAGLIGNAYKSTPFPNGGSKSPGDCVPWTLGLSLLEYGIFARVTNRYLKPWQQFIDDLMSHYDGSRWIVNGQQQRHIRIDMIRHIKTMCDLIGSDFYESGIDKSVLTSVPEKRQKQKRSLKPGWDASHVKPFAKHGNGPVFPEPSSINRSRGAQDVDNPPMHYVQ